VGQGSFTPVTADACAALGQFAATLAEGRPLSQALRLLSTGLALRSVVVRSVDGEVIGVGGDALQAVSAMRAVDGHDVWLEFPIAGQDGESLATLTVRGGRPSQLPTLRAVAAVLGLALSARIGSVSPQQLTDDAESALAEVADALHDGPLQSLMVARYAVDAAMRGGDAGAVRDAIQQAVVELRQLTWSLRPRGASGLSQALELLAAKAEDVPLELSLGQEDPTGPGAVLAYRIVQTVHAHARQPVRVIVDGRSVEITGTALPSPQRWVRRAASVGCVLSTTGEHTSLMLAAPASSSVKTEVRTTS
jgi:hypothetical protein